MSSIQKFTPNKDFENMKKNENYESIYKYSVIHRINQVSMT